jgi:hypothetical protein
MLDCACSVLQHCVPVLQQQLQETPGYGSRSTQPGFQCANAIQGFVDTGGIVHVPAHQLTSALRCMAVGTGRHAHTYDITLPTCPFATSAGTASTV